MYFGHHYPADESPLSDVIAALTENGAPTTSLPIGEATFCSIDSLTAFSPKERSECIQRAKEEVLASYLMRFTEDIRSAAFYGTDCTIPLGRFTPKPFDGRDNRRTPPEQAALNQIYYGEHISPGQVLHLTHLAFHLAGLGREQPREQPRSPVKPPLPKPILPTGSVVYFISFGEEDVVKIGFTSQLARRMSQFRSVSSVEPKLHLAIPGGRKEEQALHDRFRADHIIRELFRFSSGIEKFISKHRPPVALPPKEIEHIIHGPIPPPKYAIIPQQEYISDPRFHPTLQPLTAP